MPGKRKSPSKANASRRQKPKAVRNIVPVGAPPARLPGVNINRQNAESIETAQQLQVALEEL